MNFEYSYGTSGFESFEDSKESGKNAKKRGKISKFFKRILNKIVDAAISVISIVVIHYFDKKFEKAFA